MFKIFYSFTRIFLKDHTDFQFNYFQIMQTVLRKIFKSSNKSFYLRGMTSSNCLNNRLVRKKAFPTHTYTKEHNFIFNLTHTYIQAVRVCRKAVHFFISFTAFCPLFLCMSAHASYARCCCSLLKSICRLVHGNKLNNGNV